MGDQENVDDEEEGGYGPIRNTKLKEFVKSETDEMYSGEKMWAKDEAIEQLEQQLLEVAKHVWVDAAKETFADGRRTVGKEEIDRSFNELLLPQNTLIEAATEMKRIRWEFLDIAEQSPAINIDEDREDDEEGNGKLEGYE